MRKEFIRLINLYIRYYRVRLVLDELIFFVTYRCNFRCRTCFYASVMDEDVRGGRKELNIWEITKISRSMGNFNKLLISGGEPFLRDDLSEICGIFYRQNKIRDIHLPTNGFYTEKIYDYTYKILNECPEVSLTVSLPLDGFQQTHDKIKGIDGSFEKVKAAIVVLAGLKDRFNNLKIYLTTVVSSLNIDEAAGLAEFIKNNFPVVDSHSLSPIRGAPLDKNLLPPSFEQWENLSRKLAECRRYWDKKRLKSKLKTFLAVNRARYLYRVYTDVLKGASLSFRCQAGNIISVLEPNGDVRLCELTGVVGNVCSAGYDLKRVLSSNEAQRARDKIKNCACTHACFLDPSIKMNPVTLIKSYFLG